MAPQTILTAKNQTFPKGLDSVLQLCVAQAGALKLRQVKAFNSQLTEALWGWLLVLHALTVCKAATAPEKLAPSYRHKEPITGPRLLP